MPFFSIIIPVYNRENRLSKALDSLKNQTFKDFETIIIDDASTDNSFEIADEFELDNKIVIRNTTNKERCTSRNIGIDAAKGKYICFLDSDDYHLPEHLEKTYNFIKEKEEPVAFFFTNAWDESEDGIRSERHCPDFEKYNPYTYFLRYTANPQRWAMHRDIFNDIKFDPEITIAEDLDTSLRIVNAGYKVFQIKNRTTVYVAAKDSFTHGTSDKWEKYLFYYNKIFKREELKNKLKASEKRRLISMCHFNLAVKAIDLSLRKHFYRHALKSFVLCPRGYNKKTNKILFVNSLYFCPIIGKIAKKIRNSI